MKCPRTVYISLLTCDSKYMLTMEAFIFLVYIHDSVFEHEINIFPINRIYLMGGFRPSYVYIPVGLL